MVSYYSQMTMNDDELGNDRIIIPKYVFVKIKTFKTIFSLIKHEIIPLITHFMMNLVK